MMAKLEGMVMKFTIIKNSDIEKYLNDADKEALKKIIDQIELGRIFRGRGINTYLVINTDEPYADEVIDILKRNGHWG
jgi:hypothetical protein